jgi:hypothetical protein
VFEVDVDIGWLVTFPGNEALEQYRHAPGVDLGNVQAITHHRVGGGTSALAEDALVARKAHDIVNGQEVILVGEFGDQLQFFLQQGLYSRRNTTGPALLRTGITQLPQVFARAKSRRYNLVWILVTQLVERETTARGNFQGLGEQGRRVELAQTRQRSQVALGVNIQSCTQFLYRCVETDRGQGILQRLTPGHVHVYITTGQHRYTEGFGKLVQIQVPGLFVGFQQQFDGQPQASRKHAL